MGKQFNMVQLFSIIDGRLSTKIEDVYDMLNHITGQSLMTHHLPVAMDYIKKVNPKWYQDITSDLNDIKSNHGNIFEHLMPILTNSYNIIYNIPPSTELEKEGFIQYILDNSLLLNKK